MLTKEKQRKHFFFTFYFYTMSCKSFSYSTEMYMNPLPPHYKRREGNISLSSFYLHTNKKSGRNFSFLPDTCLFIHSGEKGLQPWTLRIIKDFFRGALLLNSFFVQEHNSVCNFFCKSHLMGYHYHSHTISC